MGADGEPAGGLEKRRWTLAAGGAFFLAALLALVATDLLFVSSAALPMSERLVRAKELPWVLGYCLPPGLVAALAFRRWCDGSRFLRGWGSVSAAAFMAVIFNPIAFYLVMTSFLLLGFLTLTFMIFTGFLMAFLWAWTGARWRLQS
jgi:hypothetical protein